MFVSFNKITWWEFDKGTIAGVCIPIRAKERQRLVKKNQRHALQVEAAVGEKRHHR
jgi:phosphosulfolactate synthase (CoM biosynthesis protein A)